MISNAMKAAPLPFSLEGSSFAEGGYGDSAVQGAYLIKVQQRGFGVATRHRVADMTRGAETYIHSPQCNVAPIVLSVAPGTLFNKCTCLWFRA
jgi:hypothetical protein